MARFVDIAKTEIGALCEVAPRFGYRQRAKLVADASGQLGLYRAGTHEVEDLPGCVVLEPRVRAAVVVIRELLSRSPILRGVDVVRVDGGTLVTLIAPEQANESELRAFADRLCARLPDVVGVACSERADAAVQLLGTGLRVLRGAGSAQRSFKPDGPFWYVAHGSFVQAHRDVAASIHERVMSALRAAQITPPARVLELYAGSGALALSLARAGFDVTAVEAFAPACQQIRNAASQQHLQIAVETADAGQGAQRVAAREQRVDAIFVNPPRRGLDPEVRRSIALLAPRLVGYVSCEPSTLARDVSHLAALGYALKELAPFDMMPLTDQVETFALLEPGECTPLDVLDERDAFIAIDKRPFAAVLSEHRHARSLLGRVRERRGWERAVALAPLDEPASGVCLFGRDASHREQLERALSEGSSTYVALVRGVVRHGGRIARSLGAASERREATTRFRRVEVVARHSLVRATPLGLEQPEQLAAHFAMIGHPILGADRHADERSNRHLASKHMLDRAFLHRERVVLSFPSDTITIEAPLAPDLEMVLENLRSVRAAPRETP